jgi:hypothetical protein
MRASPKIVSDMIRYAICVRRTSMLDFGPFVKQRIARRCLPIFLPRSPSMPLEGSIAYWPPISPQVNASPSRPRCSPALRRPCANGCGGGGSCHLGDFHQPRQCRRQHWVPDAIPADWMRYQSPWEYTHAARAVLQIMGLSTLMISILAETPRVDLGKRTI